MYINESLCFVIFKLFSLSLVPIFDLKGELEEAMAELEETRRKVVSLKMQKDGMCRISSPTFIAVNGSSSPDKQNISLRELKNSVEEAKVYHSFDLPIISCYQTFSSKFFFY